MTPVATATRQLLGPLLRREPGETFSRNSVRALARLIGAAALAANRTAAVGATSCAQRDSRTTMRDYNVPDEVQQCSGGPCPIDAGGNMIC